MPRDPRITGYLEANKKWAASAAHQQPITFASLQRLGRARSDGTVIVVACTDPRLCPEEFLGEGTGKLAVVRVTGGRVAAAMSSLLVLTAVGAQGEKGTVVVVHHTDCGLCYITDEEIKATLLKRVRREAEAKEVEGMVFGSIGDPEVTVKEDVTLLRESSFFRGMEIVGLIQDTETGLLKEIVVE